MPKTDATCPKCRVHNGDYLPCRKHYPQGLDLTITAPENEWYFKWLDREEEEEA